jgi:hypothetical protein
MGAAVRKPTTKTPKQAVVPRVSGATAAACLRADLARQHPYHHPSVLRDLMFLEAWEDGQILWLGAILRVRQILRANASLDSTTAS